MKTEQEYNAGVARYEAIKYQPEHREEKILLAHQISAYENSIWDLPEVSPAEYEGILKDEFGR